MCAYPSLGKKDILSTLSEPCYYHVGEEGLLVSLYKKLAKSMPRQFQMGQQGKDEKVMKITRLTYSFRLPAAAGQPGDSTLFFT